MAHLKQSSPAMKYLKYAVLALLFAIAAYGIQAQLNSRLPDAGLTTKQQVQKYGYPFEKHLVLTDDGYLLTAHRIPYGRKKTSSKAPVVLLMPGFLRSSEVWVTFGPRKSLGYILADAGFDVWLGNHRGTTWSRKHTRLDPILNAKQFWNFSLDELGYYDCPAFIDYILKTTGTTSLIYIGDTSGATMFFIMAVEKPSYNDKVKLMVAMAPMINLSNARSLIYAAASRYKVEIQFLADLFGSYEVLKHTDWLTSLGSLLCDKFIFADICEFIHYVGVGFDPSQYNKSATPLLLNGFPAGSSLKELLHISQIYRTGLFAKYDYGFEENFKKYGKAMPPEYDLSKVETPISIYYGDNDFLVSNTDVERVIPSLRSLVSKRLVRGFNNGDFLWAIDVVELVYKDIIRLMNMYELKDNKS